MTFETFINNNLAPIVGLIFLLIVLVNNETIDAKRRRLFLAVCVLEIVELIAYNLELVTAGWAHPTMLRMLLSAVGYSIRPLLVYSLMQMVKGEGRGVRWETILFLPVVFNVLCAFSVFFTDIVYSYNDQNLFVRGPLGYVTQLCTVLYLILFVITVIRKQIFEKEMELWIMLLILVYLVLSMLLETRFSMHSPGRTAIVLCTIFFLFALQTGLLKKNVSVLAENDALKAALDEVEKAKQELLRSRSVSQALGEEYLSVFQIDYDKNKVYVEKIEEGYDLSNLTDAIERNDGIEQCVMLFATEYVTEEDRAEFIDIFTGEKLREELERKNSITKRFNCKIDSDRIICIEMHVVRMPQENINRGYILGFRNVEELVQKEREQMAVMERAVQEAERANAAKSNFLSRMSHDIRTPLNGIIGLLKINEDHFDNQELVLENHKKMQVSANHLLSLINDVLQMSKLEDGNIVLTHEFISLVELTQSIVVIIIGRAVEAGITWDYEKGKSKIPYPYIYGSPVHLRQIFLNIYGNCIKYNKPGGKITTVVDTLEEKDGICTYRWTITDTGVGMSEEFLKRIYEPFAQEKNDARSVYQGTGLGMAIVKGLIDQMGGNITITSKEGEGSTFVITIPFEVAPAPVKSADDPCVAEEGDIHGRNLLLVEDNELNAEIAEVMLTDQGARVTTVYDGGQAVELFRDCPAGAFDAILMDVMMPVMDGLTATRQIRAMDREDAKRIPIIAMTANAFKEDADRCMAAGMNAHLSKPLEMDKVKRTIQEQICRAERL